MFVGLMAAGATIAFGIGWASFETAVVLLLAYTVIALVSIESKLRRLGEETLFVLRRSRHESDRG